MPSSVAISMMLKFGTSLGCKAKYFCTASNATFVPRSETRNEARTTKHGGEGEGHDAHSAALDTGVIHFYSHWAGQ